MDKLLPYMPYIMTMSPSIGIAVVYLSLTLCVSFFMGWERESGFDRNLIMIMMTVAIFGISLSIGGVLQSELPESIVQSDVYNITIHEEFLIALCVEMAGAIIFILPIYGSDRKPPHIYFSMVISIFFISLLFISPIASVSKTLLSVSPDIIDNYVSNLRIEFLSIIVLFFAISFFRISGLEKRRIQAKRSLHLFVMTVVILVLFAFFGKSILEPQYENVYLGLGAAVGTICILAVAKIHETALLLTIFLSIIVSVILLVGTQIPNFNFEPATSINIAAELIGAITVALVLDIEMRV